MNNETKHTPTPWTLLPARTLINIKGPEGRQVGQLPINSLDAEFIVRAVNAHDELVMALESTLDCLKESHDEAREQEDEEQHEKDCTYCKSIENAESVLKKIYLRG